MKHLIYIYLFLVSLAYTSYGAAAAGAGGDDPSERGAYGTGCIPSTAADWERAGVPLLTWEEIARRHQPPSAVFALSAGMGHRLTAGELTSYLPDLPESMPSLHMSAVKNQRGLGSCSTHAIVAAIEALTDMAFSEAELYIRVKTKGGATRSERGSALCKYVPLLREGLVTVDRFPSYEDLIDYISEITNPKSITFSPNYKESLEHYTRWCERNRRAIPADMRPRWREERETKDLMDEMSFVFKPTIWFWRDVCRHPVFETLVPREFPYTTVQIEPDSYYCVRFHMNRFRIYEPSHPKDPLYMLKYMLVHRTPVVISVKTFAIFDKKPDGTRKKTPKGEGIALDGWWWHDQVRSHRNIIDLPEKRFEFEDHHAICLCGYDDAAAGGKGAFRLKNSWGAWWGDNGYAWITYDYIREHKSDNDAFSINIIRR